MKPQPLNFVAPQEKAKRIDVPRGAPIAYQNNEEKKVLEFQPQKRLLREMIDPNF